MVSENGSEITHVNLDFAEPGNPVLLREIGEMGAETLNLTISSTIWPGPTSSLLPGSSLRESLLTKEKEARSSLV